MAGALDRRALLGASAAAGAVLISRPVMAAEASGPVSVRNSVEFEMKNAEGYTYRILVSLPLQPTPPEGFPVLYVLDGNSVFGTVTDMVWGQSRFPKDTGISPTIVVGIGYPIDGPFDSERRVFDLTVPTAASEFPPRPDGKPRDENATGGADAFTRFIVETVQPEIARRWKVDRNRQILSGHSLGGLFCLNMMFHHFGHFRGYIALSPSVWWKRRYILAAAKEFATRQQARVWTESLFIGVGEREQDGSESEETRMVDNARLVSDVLQPLTVRGFANGFAIAPDEHHRSAVPALISRASRFVFAAMA